MVLRPIESSVAQVLRTKFGIESGPVDLEVFKLDSNFSTPFILSLSFFPIFICTVSPTIRFNKHTIIILFINILPALKNIHIHKVRNSVAHFN